MIRSSLKFERYASFLPRLSANHRPLLSATLALAVYTGMVCASSKHPMLESGFRFWGCTWIWRESVLVVINVRADTVRPTDVCRQAGGQADGKWAVWPQRRSTSPQARWSSCLGPSAPLRCDPSTGPWAVGRRTWPDMAGPRPEARRKGGPGRGEANAFCVVCCKPAPSLAYTRAPD